jgi:threonine dehydrogenase-like Zn-dependent dehydrogenase
MANVMGETSLQTLPLLDPEHDPGTEQAHAIPNMSGEKMKAVHYEGPFKVSVKEVELPKLEHPDDVIVKVTTAAICGSDLHMYQGRTAAESGLVFGHENMGIVIETGSGVTLLEKGDRIVLPFVCAVYVRNRCETNTDFGPRM